MLNLLLDNSQERYRQDLVAQSLMLVAGRIMKKSRLWALRLSATFTMATGSHMTFSVARTFCFRLNVLAAATAGRGARYTCKRCVACANTLPTALQLMCESLLASRHLHSPDTHPASSMDLPWQSTSRQSDAPHSSYASTY